MRLLLTLLFLFPALALSTPNKLLPQYGAHGIGSMSGSGVTSQKMTALEDDSFLVHRFILNTNRYEIKKYRADTSLDASFGVFGRITVPGNLIDNFNGNFDGAIEIVSLDQGRFAVISGLGNGFRRQSSSILSLYLANNFEYRIFSNSGQPDQSIGFRGVAKFNFSSSDVIRAATISSEGRYVYLLRQTLAGSKLEQYDLHTSSVESNAPQVVSNYQFEHQFTINECPLVKLNGKTIWVEIIGCFAGFTPAGFDPVTQTNVSFPPSSPDATWTQMRIDIQPAGNSQTYQTTTFNLGANVIGDVLADGGFYRTANFDNAAQFGCTRCQMKYLKTAQLDLAYGNQGIVDLDIAEAWFDSKLIDRNGNLHLSYINNEILKYRVFDASGRIKKRLDLPRNLQSMGSSSIYGSAVNRSGNLFLELSAGSNDRSEYRLYLQRFNEQSTSHSISQPNTTSIALEVAELFTAPPSCDQNGKWLGLSANKLETSPSSNVLQFEVQYRLQKLNAGGEFDSEFGDRGIIPINFDNLSLGGFNIEPLSFVLKDEQARYLLALQSVSRFSQFTNAQSVRLVRLQTNGERDLNYGANGVVVIPLRSDEEVLWQTQMISGERVILALHDRSAGQTRLLAYDEFGRADPYFGNNGGLIIQSTPGLSQIQNLSPLPDGNVSLVSLGQDRVIHRVIDPQGRIIKSKDITPNMLSEFGWGDRLKSISQAKILSNGDVVLLGGVAERDANTTDYRSESFVMMLNSSYLPRQSFGQNGMITRQHQGITYAFGIDEISDQEFVLFLAQTPNRSETDTDGAGPFLDSGTTLEARNIIVTRLNKDGRVVSNIAEENFSVTVAYQSVFYADNSLVNFTNPIKLSNACAIAPGETSYAIYNEAISNINGFSGALIALDTRLQLGQTIPTSRKPQPIIVTSPPVEDGISIKNPHKPVRPIRTSRNNLH